MVNLYVDLINKGLRVLEQVPMLWREEVRLRLEEAANL